MLIFHSPAKINLFLKIINKRPDAYHNLSSLFQTISLFDTLSFISFECTQNKEPVNVLTCTDPLIPTDERNLILKAVKAFYNATKNQSKYSIKLNSLKIHLEKNIPHQAGLGGGSSNAATTLWALNKIYQNLFTIDKLIEIASGIGSDVPFFLSQGTAHCVGKGEEVHPLPQLISLPSSLWIIKPPFGLSTPEVYKHFKLNSTLSWDEEIALKSFVNQVGTPQYFNDLEKPAFTLLPILADLKQRLLEVGFEQVLLCGSGSSLFCVGNPSFSPLQTCEEVLDVKRDSIFCKQVVPINRENEKWYDLKHSFENAFDKACLKS